MNPTPKLIQFGAGAIGRSFLGQLFSRAGWQVVFVDVNATVVEALNARRRYRVMVKHSDRPEETLWIENVRAVDGRDAEAVAAEVADADMVATAVGQRALGAVLPVLAQGLLARRAAHGDRPLDIILAENLHGAAQVVTDGLRARLPDAFPLDRLVGLVETSIGKMVPIMRDEDLARDPLWVFAEPYNELILDGRAFRNPIPAVPGLAPMDNMQAYGDRKLYIHNLGHAATAYFGYLRHPGRAFIYEVLEDAEVYESARLAMTQSAAVLCREYPDAFDMAALEAHRDDLLARFANRALGDTVYRVGRDLVRKLARHDRLVGALLLAARHGLPCDRIAAAYVAGTQFRAGDDQGRLFPPDEKFARETFPGGLAHILESVSGLSPAAAGDCDVIAMVLQAAGQALPEAH